MITIFAVGDRVIDTDGHAGTIVRMNLFYAGGVWVQFDNEKDWGRTLLFTSELRHAQDSDFPINPIEFETATGALR